MKFPRLVDAELPESAARMIGRFYFGTTGAAALLSAAILSISPPGLPSLERESIVASVLVLALICVIAMQRSPRPRFPMSLALLSVGFLTIVLCQVISVTLGEGLRSAPIAFCALVVCVVGSITTSRHAATLGTLAAIGMVTMYWLEAGGYMQGQQAPTPLAMVLAFQLVILASGAVGGSLIAHALSRSLHAAAQREQRFRGLLRLAADWYWEQDASFKFTYVSEASAENPFENRRDEPERRSAVRVPWQIDDMGLSDEQLDAHRADLEAHRPFSGVLARRRDANGRSRTVSISGEPKYAQNGMFAGYWGVARDVTREMRTQRAMAASETRYRELFTRSPSPLFLHRNGLVFDANEAAARLFGFENAAAMNGFNLLGLFPAGEARERVLDRMAALEAMAIGEGLPVADYQMHAADGRPLSVQSTGVRVDTASGPATMAIFYDVTARQAVEAALRRSEAMLSHLFATSPECITLTEAGTGRYAMVNQAFCRLTGYSSEEIVGRSAVELGIWHDTATRDRLLALLERDNHVVDFPAQFVVKSGAVISMLLAAGRFQMDDRDYLVLNSRDVTESERTRQQHTAILERASIGIAFTRDRLFVQANPFFERMFGWEAGELPGQAGSVVWANDEDYAEISALAGPLLAAGRPFEIERRMCRKDGSRFWCRLLAQAVDRADPSRGGTIWIAEDVTERRRLDEALAAARDAAEAASRAKSAFLANTSHEIRTPLNGLLGLTRLAMQEKVADDRRQQYLAQILDSAQSLAGIMSDILDVSKIEAGKFALEDRPFDLRDLLRAVHHAYQSLAESKGLRLRLSIVEPMPATVRGDAVRVRQILSNFITNALKFTERGQVRIEASASVHGAIRLAVTDTGPGVHADLKERLFTPFSQGDSSTTRRYGGTGLGLSICRELAQLMGGSVGVESKPGIGSTFWAELPLPHSAAPRSTTSTEPGDLERLGGARVLMAEDNPVNMMIAVAMLEHWGVIVEQAADGRSAIEAVHAAAQRGEPFDAVVMDVQMPVMGGHDAARELRHHYDAGVLPIVALTAAALTSERDEALAAGMNDFLTKPIDAARLRHTLASLVRRRESV